MLRSAKRCAADPGTTSAASVARKKNQWNHCPALVAKIFSFPFDPNHRLIPCCPVPNEGRLAIVTNAGRDAVDADAQMTNSA